MKKLVALLLSLVFLLTCIALSGCNSSSRDDDDQDDLDNRNDIIYEELFLGKWSNDDALFSFQYKDDTYCGGAMSSELSTVVFEKYTATRTTLTLYIEGGRIETFYYEFEDGYLYIDDIKLEKFD